MAKRTGQPPWKPGSIDVSSLLYFDEAAEYLDCTDRQLRRWVFNKQIPYYKVGKYLRFSPPELDAWLGQRVHGHHAGVSARPVRPGRRTPTGRRRAS